MKTISLVNPLYEGRLFFWKSEVFQFSSITSIVESCEIINFLAFDFITGKEIAFIVSFEDWNEMWEGIVS